MITSDRAPARGLVVSLVSTLVLLVLLAAAPPARAHDVLVGSVPAEGAVLEESPGQIVLTFSAEVLELSPVIVVTGADGAVAADGDPTVDGATVTLDVPAPLTGGDYRAAWRVVSSDGHPIEGVVAFSMATSTAGAEPTMTTTGTPSPEPADTGEARGADDAAPDDAAPGATNDSEGDGSGLGGLPTWLKVALMLAATASVVGLIVITVRRDRDGR